MSSNSVSISELIVEKEQQTERHSETESKLLSVSQGILKLVSLYYYLLIIITLLNCTINFVLILTLHLIFCELYRYLSVAVSLNLHITPECGSAVRPVLVLTVEDTQQLQQDQEHLLL